VTVRLRQAIWWAIAGGLALVLLRYSLQGIEWRRVGSIVAGANIPRLAIAAALGVSTLFLRACRWRVLLNAKGSVSVGMAFWATAAGYFGNNFLPARAGELVRTYFVGSAARLEYPYVLATALAERVTDALVLVGVALAVLLTGDVRPDWLAAAAKPIGIVAVLAGAAIVLLPFLGRFVEAIVARLPIRADRRTRLATALHDALAGLRAFHHPWRVTAFFALTAVIWTGDAASTVVAASALGLHITFPAAFLLLASLGLSSALPSTPGYVGIFQFVAVTVLVPFGLSRTDAIAYILTAQALNYVIIGVCGSIALARYRALRREPRMNTEEDSHG
jgi:glycosyltransferase 2 family protein